MRQIAPSTLYGPTQGKLSTLQEKLKNAHTSLEQAFAEEMPTPSQHPEMLDLSRHSLCC